MPTYTTPRCNFPEHHHGGGGFPWGLAIIAAAGVIIATSGTFATVVHDVMVIVISAVAAVAVAGLGGMALWLHHQRAMCPRQLEAPRPIHLTARLEPQTAVERGQTTRAALGSGMTGQSAATRQPGRTGALAPARKDWRR
jgi:hypothetical protein